MSRRKSIDGPELTYEEISPGEYLRNMIDRFWYCRCLKGSDKQISFYLLPLYTSSLIFIRGFYSGESKFFISSPILKKIKITATEDAEMACAIIKPLVINSILKIQDSSAVNRISNVERVAPEDIFQEVNERLKLAVTPAGLINTLKYFFDRLKDKYVQPDIQIKKAVELMLESEGKLKLEDIYKTLSISARQFQRKFTALSGLKPKEFMRLVRLTKAASKLVKEGYDHFDVLTEAGYYDQSHYDKEFREIYGTKPTDFEASQKLIKHINLFY